MNRWLTPITLLRSTLFAIALASSLAGPLACDEAPTVPQEVLDKVNKKEEPSDLPKRPTTQELLSGPRSRTALIPLPLTMELPPGWGKDKNLAPNLIQGWTPSGQVLIQLTSRPSLKQEELDRLLAAAKKEQADNPQTFPRVELRPLGSVRVLERQKVGRPAPFTVYDEQQQPHTTTESNFTWTLSVLVPSDGAFQNFELNFIGLTKSQYDKDKEFLHSILATLDYAGDNAAPPPPAPSAPGAATLPATPGGLQ